MAILDNLPLIRLGCPLVPNGKLYCYAGGAYSVLQDVYTTQAGSVAHANPVVADSDGLFPGIYVAALAYNFRLKSSDEGTVYWSEANVAGPNYGALIDTGFVLKNVSDPTKKLQLTLSGLTTATTRIWTVQDKDGVVALGESISVHLQTAAEMVDQSFWIAPYACVVDRIDFIASAAESTANPAVVQVVLDTGTDAPGAGTNILTNNTSAGFNLRSTANTVQNGTFATTALAAGNRLSLDFASTGTITEAAGLTATVTVRRTA